MKRLIAATLFASFVAAFFPSCESTVSSDRANRDSGRPMAQSLRDTSRYY